MLSRAILRKENLQGQHASVTLGPDEYKRNVAERVMASIDTMSPDWRALVHEYGYNKIVAMRRKFHTAAAAALHLTLWELEL